MPTTYEPACVVGKSLEHTKSKLPDAVVQQVHYNIGALLVGGVVALIVGIVVFVVEQRRDGKTSTASVRGRLVLLAFTALLMAVGTALLANDDILDLHGWSASAHVRGARGRF